MIGFGAIEEVALAQQAVEVAYNRFNWTTERDYGRLALDSCIYTVAAAELTVRAAFNRQRIPASKVAREERS